MKSLKRPARANEESRTPPPAVLLVLLALLLVGLAQTTAGKSILRSIGIYGPSQPFTELYFAQPQRIARLTASLDKAPAAVQMAFVIANREHRMIRYHWVIVANGSSRASGHATLRAMFSTRISRTVATGCVLSPRRVGKPAGRGASKDPEPKQAKLSVMLTSPAESIDVLIPCNA